MQQQALTRPSADAIRPNEDRNTHTPSPWHVMEQGFGKVPCPTVYATDTDLRYIAVCSDHMTTGQPTDNLANARLIAAAPDMLAALQRQLVNIERRLETDEPAGWAESAAIYQQMKDAVAKATDVEINL